MFRIKYVEPYHQAFIEIFPEATKMYLDDKLEELDAAIVHELCHMHTNKLTDLAEDRYASKREIGDACEDLTETMAQYVLMIKKLKGIK